MPNSEPESNQSESKNLPSPIPEENGAQQKDDNSLLTRFHSLVSRRRIISGTLALGAVTLINKISKVAGQNTSSSPILDPANDTSKTPGPPGRKFGERSPHSKISRFLRPGRPWTSGTPHEDLSGTITPSDLHFERHHAGVPTIDPSKYALLIHGLVDRPLVFTLEDIKLFPSVSSIHFLECSGHYPRNADEKTKPSRVAPLLSNSQWTGVPLHLLLKEAGVHPDATWLIAEGQDGAKLMRSIPIEKAWDDSIIAYGQNGEPLRPEQGYPVRLFNPGWEGGSSVKWLRRIEVTKQPSMARDETSKYTEYVGKDKIRQFSYVMEVRSLITSPGYPQKLKPGKINIQGMAWSGKGKISKVEISLDNRQTWQEAQLQGPILAKSFTRFQYLWIGMVILRLFGAELLIKPGMFNQPWRSTFRFEAPKRGITITSWSVGILNLPERSCTKFKIGKYHDQKTSNYIVPYSNWLFFSAPGESILT